MVGAVKKLQRDALAEFFAYRTQFGEIGQRIARALQEQHRDFYLEQMLRAITRRAASRMQGKAKERQAGQKKKETSDQCRGTVEQSEGAKVWFA